MNKEEYIKKYIKVTIDSYNKTHDSENNFLDYVNLVNVEQPDGSFTKIVIAIKNINDEWFKENNNIDASLVFSDYGRAISQGELKFIAEKLAQKETFSSIDINNIKNIKANIIITNINTKYELIKKRIVDYDYTRKGYCINGIPIFEVHSDLLNNKLLVIENYNWGNVEVVNFENNETINVEIKPNEHKFLGYSMFKVNIENPNKIKVYKLGDE